MDLWVEILILLPRSTINFYVQTFTNKIYYMVTNDKVDWLLEVNKDISHIFLKVCAQPQSFSRSGNDYFDCFHIASSLSMFEYSQNTMGDKVAYLYSLNEQHSLWIILVSLQDEVSQFVDDDIQGTLLLQRLAEIQLWREENNHGSRIMAQTGPSYTWVFIYYI